MSKGLRTEVVVILLIVFFLSGIGVGTFLIQPPRVDRTTTFTVTQTVTSTELLIPTTPPFRFLAPAWLDDAIDEIRTRAEPFASKRGISLGPEIYLTLRTEIILAFQSGTVSTKEEAIKASLIHLGVTILEAKKVGLNQISSTDFYETWSKVLREPVGIPHNPFSSWKSSVLNREEKWVRTYPELGELLCCYP